MKAFGNRANILALGFLTSLACIAFQHSYAVLEALYSHTNFVFSESTSGSGKWLARSCKLHSGKYFLSVGRPRAVCSISINGSQLASTKSPITELRNNLMLGTGFVVKQDLEPIEILIQCEHTAGFSGDFTHPPLVMTFFPGVVVHIWRALTELLIGPLASLLLLLSAFFRPGESNREIEQERQFFENWHYVFFGSASLLYSVSLAYYTRLFLGGMAATIVHIIVRNLFAFASLLLFSPVTSKWNRLTWAQGGLCLITLAFGLFAPGKIVEFYTWEYLFMPFCAGALAATELRKPLSTRSALLFRSILCSWAMIQTIDASLLWTGVGAYTAPTVVLLLATTAFWLRHQEQQLAISNHLAVRNILSSIESQSDIRSIVRELSAITRREGKFESAAGYVDSFVLGLSGAPGISFELVTAKAGEWSQPQILLKTSDSISTAVHQAYADGKLALSEESAVNNFVVVPIGKLATLLLKIHPSRMLHEKNESLAIVRRLMGFLKPLERRLNEMEQRQSDALQKLSALRGRGAWQVPVGILFLDVNDYSKSSEEFGLPFNTFISETYFPALLRAVGSYAAAEHIAGDEVLLISHPSLIPSHLDVSQAVVATLVAVDGFAQNAGAELCSEHGFSRVTLSLGVNIDAVTIVSDSSRVRTTGNAIVHAKRLQEEAGKEGILVKAGTSISLPQSEYALGEEFLILRKKLVVKAQRIIRKRSMRNAA